MRGVCGVNFSRFSAPLVGSPGNPVSLRRRREEETKSQRVKESKRRRDKKTKRQSDEGTKRRRDEGTKRGRDKGTRRRKPRHLLFVSSSPPLHLLFTSSLPLNSFNSCTKTFARFVFHNSFTQRTPLCESSVKVNVEGKVRVGGKGRGCAVTLITTQPRQIMFLDVIHTYSYFT